MQHDLTTLIDDLPTEALELYVMEWEGPGVGGYHGHSWPLGKAAIIDGCRCPRAALGYRMAHVRRAVTMTWRTFLHSDHPADRIEAMAHKGTLDTEALYRACKAGILARDAAVERVREEVGVG